MREKSFIQLIEKPLDFSHLFVAVYIYITVFLLVPQASSHIPV